MIGTTKQPFKAKVRPYTWPCTSKNNRWCQFYASEAKLSQLLWKGRGGKKARKGYVTKAIEIGHSEMIISEMKSWNDKSTLLVVIKYELGIIALARVDCAFSSAFVRIICPARGRSVSFFLGSQNEWQDDGTSLFLNWLRKITMQRHLHSYKPNKRVGWKMGQN